MVFRALTRHYSLHEFHAKDLFRDFGVRVQKGGLASSVENAKSLASTLNPVLMLKANVQAGGRGKGYLSSGLKGGVQFCNNVDDVTNYSKQMLGYNIVTKQTPAEGLPVNSVLILESVDIVKQYYLAFVLDRDVGGPAVIVSKHGGMDIEETSETDPDSIIIEKIDIKQGLTDQQAAHLVDRLEFDDVYKQEARLQLQQLYRTFIESDSLQIEVNPWATTPDGLVYCVDAKVNVDDNALFRQKKVKQYKKEAERDEIVDANEKRAEELGVSYVSMDGNVGCLVNGAGLAMATMDVIQLCGGSPANFLDVGGGANKEQMTESFKLLFAHPKVEAVFVNIFGGILKCDMIAQALVDVKNEIGFPRPVVVRLQGTNVEEGARIIRENSDENLHVDNNMEDAATLAIKLAAAR